MSCLALAAAPYNNNENNNNDNSNNDNSNNDNSNISNNVTIPKKKSQTYKNTKKINKNTVIEDVYKSLDNNNNGNSNSESTTNEQALGPIQPIHTENSDRHVQKEAFTKLESTYANDYYKQYMPYQGQYQVPRPGVDGNNELLKKLDNILVLLEEQQEEKTNLITEELILYVFLGVFVIYVLDSFVRVGR